MRFAAIALLLAVGCNDPAPAQPPRARLVPRTVVVDGRTRHYLLQLPTAVPAGVRVPLVLAFHGAGATARRFVDESALAEEAARSGFAIAFPDGVERRWRDGIVISSRGGVDDYAFVRALIADVGRQTPVDARRLFAMGHSNGAFFTQALACRMPGTFAAIGAVAGQLSSELAATCGRGPGPSAVHVHGTRDELVPFAGGPFGRGVTLLPVERSAAFHAARAGCTGGTRRGALQTRTAGDGRGVRHIAHQGCPAGRRSDLWVVEGGSHRWPGEPGRHRTGTGSTGPATSRALDAAELLMTFFASQPPIR